MRRLGTILLAAALGATLSGCDTLALLPYAREMEDMALLRTLGVDVGQTHALAVTGSTGVQSGGANKADKPPILVASEADTISAAGLDMRAAGAAYLFYGHVNQLLLGEALAQRDARGPLDYVLRDVEMRLDTQVYVVMGGTAGEAIAAAAGAETSSADQLDAMAEDVAVLSHTALRTVNDVLGDLERSGSTFVPALGAESGLDAVGYAVLKDGTLAGWAVGDAADGINLLLGEVEADVVEIPVTGETVALRVVGAKTRVTPVFEGDTLTRVELVCTVDANLAEAGSDLNLRERKTLEMCRDALAQVEERRILAALDLSRTLDADYLDLMRAAGLCTPWRWQELQRQWNPAELRVDVQVNTTIRRSYDAEW